MQISEKEKGEMAMIHHRGFPNRISGPMGVLITKGTASAERKSLSKYCHSLIR
jgi:hypothetical protein